MEYGRTFLSLFNSESSSHKTNGEDDEEISFNTVWGKKRKEKKKILFYRNRKGLHFISARVQYVPVSLPWSVLELEWEFIRGSVEAEPWPLVLGSGPEELHSASFPGWRPGEPAEEDREDKV